jgi:hypothetical protein
MSRPRIPILIVAFFPSRSPRYSRNCASPAFSYHAVSGTNPEDNVMSTVDANRVILTGENSVLDQRAILADPPAEGPIP